MSKKKPKITDQYLNDAVKAKNIAETMNECLWVGDKDHKTVYVNPTFERTSGYTLDECIGRDCISFFDEEGRKTIENHHKMRPKGKSSQYEANIVTKDGKKVPLFISGAPTKSGGTIGIFTNLAKLKKLSEKQQFAEHIIRNSTEAIVILDKNRRIKIWNNGAAKIFGYKEKEVLNKLISIIIPKEEEDMNKKLLDEVEKKRFLKNFETRRLTKNGNIIDVSLSVTKVMDEEDSFIGYLLLYRDISHQKKINSELQKRFEAIQDAYKELGLQKRQMDYIYEIVEQTITPGTSSNLEKLIVSAICMLTKCDGAVLRLYDKERKSLQLKSCVGISQKWWDKNKIPYKNSLAEEAIKAKRPLIIDEIDNSPKHKGVQLLKAHNFRTLIMIPLFVENIIVGSLSIYAVDPSIFRLIETDFLEKFGKQCAISLHLKTLLHPEKS